MKFECEKSILLDAVRAAGAAVSAVNLPVEQNIRLHLNGKDLTVVGNDQNLTIQKQISVNGIEDGEICVPSKKTIDLVGALNQSTSIEIINVDDHASDSELPESPDFDDEELPATALAGSPVNIISGNTKYILHQFQASSSEMLEKNKDAAASKISAQKFIAGLKQVIGMTSTSPSRPALNGVYIAMEETGKTKCLRLVASDTFRLGISDLEGISLPGSEPVLIPAASLNRLISLIGEEEELEIFVEPTQASFVFGNTTIVTQLLPAEFPEYKKLLPDDYPDILTVSRDGLSAALMRVAIMARDDENQLVRAVLKKDSMDLSAQDKKTGSGLDTIPASFSGEEISVGFNAVFMQEILKNLPDKEITAALNGALKPIHIKGTETSGFQALLMPVRLRPDS